MNDIEKRMKSYFEIYSNDTVGYFDEHAIKFFVDSEHVENIDKMNKMAGISEFKIFQNL